MIAINEAEVACDGKLVLPNIKYLWKTKDGVEASARSGERGGFGATPA